MEAIRARRRLGLGGEIIKHIGEQRRRAIAKPVPVFVALEEASAATLPRAVQAIAGLPWRLASHRDSLHQENRSVFRLRPELDRVTVVPR